MSCAFCASGLLFRPVSSLFVTTLRLLKVLYSIHTALLIALEPDRVLPPTRILLEFSQGIGASH